MTEVACARLQELEAKYGSLSPAGALDTVVSIEDGVVDVVLAPPKVVELTFSLQDAPEDRWRELAETAHDPDVQAVAERRANEVALVRLALEQMVGSPTDGAVDRSAEIAAAEEALYGHYSPILFRSAVKEKMRIIEDLTLDPDMEMPRAQLLDELQAFVGDESEVPDLVRPNPETLDAVRGWLEDQFGDILDEIDTDELETYSADDIAKLFQLCIDTTPALRENGWRAETIVREKSAIAVRACERKVIIPTQRVAEKKIVRKLIIHELFWHALRSGIARARGSGIGQNGTATYDSFEESSAIAMEQCLEGKHDPSRGLNYYLAIGLSITGGLSKDHIAHIFRTMHMLENGKKGLTPDVIAKADAFAAIQIRQAFTGMTDVDDGIPHRKNINYLHGLDNAWRLLNFMVANNCLDAGMRWLLAAKFNPFNERDRALASKVVPMPQELGAFFPNQVDQVA